MRFRIHIVLMATLLATLSCTPRELDRTAQEESILMDNGIKASSLQKGRMRIYVSEQTASRLENNPDILAEEYPDLNITSVQRTFPDAGIFEERTRAEGLHRWYDVEFDKEVPLTKAGTTVRSKEGIGLVEYIPRIKRPEWHDVTWQHNNPGTFDLSTKASYSDPAPFNDPYFKEQWHFYNRNLRSAMAKDGCDINVLQVWNNLKCGDENVVVAVVDGGIDYKHDDLIPNLWQNPEQSGTKAYGYNFVNNSYVVTAEDHGTHVAGIIAAANNNRTGGCGIAGGNVAEGVPGVRLMSCQIFTQGTDDSGDDIKAIKWAADHGAVICQNSWAYDDIDWMPLSTKQAIDYFNTYAGCDKSGNQTGPMKGGLVVFAASNEGQSTKVYPPSYEGVIAVSALAADYRLASYSNYGDWVDIAAPGGDGDFSIFSTVTKNSYAYYDGTSMAAPHVSGVAALIVANCGGEGFTREALINMLLEHSTDISGDNPGKYPGTGLANANSAVAWRDTPPTFSISDCELQAVGSKILANISVTEGSDHQNWISAARIYHSTQPFYSTEGIPYSTAYVRGVSMDSPFNLETEKLEYGTKYYVAISLVDEFGNCTPISECQEFVTEANLPPTIVPLNPSDNLTVHPHDLVELEFDVSDPFLDETTTQLDSDDEGAVIMSVSGTFVKVSISGQSSTPGSHSFTLTASDPYGLSATLTVPYTAVENTPPEIVGDIEDIIIPAGETINLNLTDFIRDADKERLNYEFKIDDPSILKVSVNDDTASLIPKQYGATAVTVTATDFAGETVTLAFKVLIRDQSCTVELYPNPTADGKLYLRVGEVREVKVSVINAAGATVLSENLTMEPFSPAVIDLAGHIPGVYLVTTETGGETLTRRVIKL